MIASDPRAYARGYLLPRLRRWRVLTVAPSALPSLPFTLTPVSRLLNLQPPDAASVSRGVQRSVFLMVHKIDNHRVWQILR